MANDEKLRMDHVKKAHDLMNRFKEGPRQLESATILSEVLKGRDVQRSLNREMDTIAKGKHLQQGQEIIEQAYQWIEDQNRKMSEKKQQTDKFKRDLNNMVKENQKHQKEVNLKREELHKKKRDAADQELQEQIEREQAILQRKKELRRKNALEAMRMTEQRRLRDKQEDTIENKIIEVYANGKKTIEDMKRMKAKEKADALFNRKHVLEEQLHESFMNAQKIEDQRVEKAISEEKIKLQQKDREKVEHERKMKAVRIQQHFDDIAREKVLEQEKLNEAQMDRETRNKNQQVNEDYALQLKIRKFNLAADNRKALQKQIAEKNAEKERIRNDTSERDHQIKENKEDDENFFAYADELRKDAEDKGRSLIPIGKVIKYYRKHNRLDSPIGVLPHLKSNVPIYMNCKSCEPVSLIKTYNPDELMALYK